MIDQNELLALGIALTRTIRERIKYSANIKSFFPDKKTALYRSLDKKLSNLRDQGHISFSDRAQAALAAGCGNCGELACCIMFLASILPQMFDQEIYISLIHFDTDHCLVMLHQSEDLSTQDIEYKKIIDLWEIKDLDNAVIIDPWIYKAVKLLNFVELYKQAKSYEVENFYKSGIQLNFRECYSSMSQLNNNYFQDYTQIIDRCLDIYDERLYKQEERRNSIEGERRRLSEIQYHNSIRYSFEESIESFKEVERNHLDDLIKFFERLRESASSWYNTGLRSNRKEKCIDNAIEALGRYHEYGYLPNEFGMKELFYVVLRVAPLVRGKSLRDNICAHNVQMTKTAKALFDYRVVPVRAYSFEDIDGLSLDFIRTIRDEPLMQRQKYISLLNNLYVYNRLSFDIEGDNLLLSLYDKRFKVACYADIKESIRYIKYQDRLIF